MWRLSKKAAILLLFSLQIFTSCSDDDLQKATAISSKKVTLSKDRSYGVEVIYSDSAYVKAKGFAPILDQVKPQIGAYYNEMPKGVKIDFFDNFLKKTGTITSDYAIHKETEKITIFRKNVVVVTESMTFNTEELTWDENKKLYSSPYGKVTGKDGSVLTGTKFSAPQDFSTYSIIQAEGKTDINGDIIP